MDAPEVFLPEAPPAVVRFPDLTPRRVDIPRQWPLPVYLGFDRREIDAFTVAVRSLRQRSSLALDVRPILQPLLRGLGIYRRPEEIRDGRIWDRISGAWCATEFSTARFAVPLLQDAGWAVWADSDVLWRRDVADLMALADGRYAVQVVKHDFAPARTGKMDGQAQQLYPRKLWSAVVLWQCGHPANRALTVEMLNTVPGRDLHRFCWLPDELIGELPAEWQWLPGHSRGDDPALVHFTEGGPDMQGYEQQPFADEWRAVRDAV